MKGNLGKHVWPTAGGLGEHQPPSIARHAETEEKTNGNVVWRGPCLASGGQAWDASTWGARDPTTHHNATGWSAAAIFKGSRRQIPV